MRKNCSSDREKLLKFKLEGQEFTNILQSLEPFIQTAKGQLQFFGTEWFFNFFLEVSQIRTIIIRIEKNNWDLETYRKS